ncbi:MAG: hypothetical protein M1816_007701 [Peltula sp. TS41687]|nr:MAG: hypothetical protein M1816_007701 [Peltula sp. TS41687]
MSGKGSLIIGTCIFLACFTFLVLLLRLWARGFVVRSVGVDDYLIIAACLIDWAHTSSVIIAAKNGLGEHVQAIAPAQFVTYRKATFIDAILYAACLGMIKLSVLTLYLRFSGKALRIASLIMLGVVIAQTVANVLVSIFMCTPVQVFWSPTLARKASCIDFPRFWLASAGTNILTDFLVYLLPMPTLWRLQISFRQKMGLICILGLGFFSCISSILRLTYIPRTLSTPDFTYYTADVILWSVIEPSIAIIAVSIPSLKPLAKRYLPGLIRSDPSGPSPQNPIRPAHGPGRKKESYGHTIEPAPWKQIP